MATGSYSLNVIAEESHLTDRADKPYPFSEVPYCVMHPDLSHLQNNGPNLQRYYEQSLKRLLHFGSIWKV